MTMINIYYISTLYIDFMYMFMHTVFILKIKNKWILNVKMRDVVKKDISAS